MKIRSCLIAIIILLFFSTDALSHKTNAENRLISAQDFNRCFPLRDKFFTYTTFTQAISTMALIKIKIEKRGDWIYKITRTDKKTGKEKVVRQDKDWDENWAKTKPYSISLIDYSSFCDNKKELAAFFAHIAHETRNGINNKFNDGLMLKYEVDTTLTYTTQNLVYPAVQGQKYYGRGPLQLSYNTNYGFASECIFGNKTTLLNNPNLVTGNATLAFETAIYFWMTPQGNKPSAHDVITGKWNPSAAEIKKGYKPGFGMTINLINGALECNKGENIPAMKDRIGFYQYFLKALKVNDANCSCTCAQMEPFPG